MRTAPPTTVRNRRGSELLLIVLALVIAMAAYANIGLAVQGSIPANFYVYSATMAAIALVMHLVVRKVAPFADPLIVPLALALNGIGLAMIFRIDLAKDTTLAIKQVMWTGVGVAAACLVLIFIKDHRWLRRYSYIFMIAAIALALSPLIPGLGRGHYGAQIWINIGPFSLQPAELSKILLAIFFAAYLVENRDRLAIGGPKFMGLHLPRMRDFGPILLVWLASLGILISQRDLGTSLLFFGLFVAMLYLATERTSWIIIGGLLFAGGAGVVLTQFAHVQQRFEGWLHALDADVYASGTSEQLVRGLFGMASGGLFGTGWGQGNPQSVPFSYSDFIIPSLGEELGMVGLFAILVMYLLLVERGFRVALSTRDGFGKLLAGGLAFVVAWQCFVVIGGVTRLIPLTGLTTPFLAYGGSSLLANWVIVGLLLRISDNARRPIPLPLRGSAGRTLSDESPVGHDGFGSQDEQLSDQPLGRRAPGASVQYVGEVGETANAESGLTGVVMRRSTKSYANSTSESGGFGSTEAQKTEVHRFDVQQVPVQQAVVEPLADENTSVEHASVQQTPVQQIGEQTPVQQTPVKQLDLGTPPPPPRSSLPPSVAPRAHRSRPTDDTELVSVSANTADSAADTGEENRS